jgi:hypothetical protein
MADKPREQVSFSRSPHLSLFVFRLVFEMRMDWWIVVAVSIWKKNLYTQHTHSTAHISSINRKKYHFPFGHSVNIKRKKIENRYYIFIIFYYRKWSYTIAYIIKNERVLRASDNNVWNYGYINGLLFFCMNSSSAIDFFLFWPTVSDIKNRP